MKINECITESWNSGKKYPDTEQGAIDCFTDISEYKPSEITKVYPDPYTPNVWAIHTSTKRYGPQKHVVWLDELDFATDDRSGEEDFKVNESTTSGAIATVAAPMSTQKRNGVGKGVYGNEKPGNLLTGKKTSKPYANSVNESKMKQIAMDLENMQNGNFKQKYGKTKEQVKMSLGDPSKNKSVQEAQLEEEDLILIPGQGHRLKAGFHAFDPDKAEHEGETLKNSLRTIARNAKELHRRLEDHDQFPEWVSEKIGTIKGMMTAVTEYLISSQEPSEGVIAAGGVGEAKKNNKLSWHAMVVKWGKDGNAITSPISWDAEGDQALVASNENGEAVITWDDATRRFILTVNGKQHDVPGSHKYPTQAKELAAKILSGVNESLANWNMGIQSIPRTSEWKRKTITAISPGPWPKEYTFDTEQEAIQHFTKAGWEKIKAGVPTKSGKPWQVIYADDVSEGKGLWANIHAKRERIKRGSGERMRKPGSKGAPSDQDFKDAANEDIEDDSELENFTKGQTVYLKNRTKPNSPTSGKVISVGENFVIIDAYPGGRYKARRDNLTADRKKGFLYVNYGKGREQQ